MARFSLKWLLVGTAIVGLAVAALVNANVWWSSAVNASVLCVVFYAGVRSCVPNAPGRPFWLGFAASAVLSTVVAIQLSGALIPLGITRYLAARATGHDVSFGDDSRWWISSPTEPRFRYISEIAHALWMAAFGIVGGVLVLYLTRKHSGVGGSERQDVSRGESC